MAITVRQQVDNGASGTGAISLTLSSALVGDTIVIVHADNFHIASDLTVPTGTAVSSYGTVKHTLDGGTDDGHIKVWMGTVTTAGGTAVEGTNNTDHERYFGAWVLAGAVSFDTASSTDSDAVSSSHVAPSVTPTLTGQDHLLICLFDDANNGTAVDYTMPGGAMTSGTERDMATFMTARAGWEQLSGDSATGTRTATASASTLWQALSAIVSQAATAGGALSFRPGKSWKRVYKHPQRLPFPPPSAVDIRNDTGLVILSLSADAAVKKVAVVAATSSLGLASTGTAKKVAPATGISPVGLSASFAHVDIRPVTATATIGLAATSTARKVTPATLNGPLGLAGTVTAKKVSRPSAVGTAGLTGTVSARKLAPVTGRGVMGLQASFAHVEIHPITALGELGVTALATVKKRATPLAVGTIGLTGNLLPKKISKSTGAGTVGLASAVTARKRQAVTGRATVGLSAWWEILPIIVGGDLYVADRRVSSINARRRDVADLSESSRRTTTLEGKPR